MLCNRCKNQIADNSTTCEWCGAVVEKPKPVMQIGQAPISELDAEIIEFLKKGQKTEALNLYKQRTGLSPDDCEYYVARLNFFLTHEHTTEAVWQSHVKNSQKGRVLSKTMGCIFLPFIGFFILLGIIIMGGYATESGKEPDPNDFWYGLVFSIILIIPAFFLIRWMLRSKKKLL